MNIDHNQSFDEKIAYRFEVLVKSFEELHRNFEWSENVFLNKNILLHVIESYYQDIDRYKKFHGSDWADRHKKAAFTIKWITKLKPVGLKFYEQTPAAELLSNYYFAVLCGLSFLTETNQDIDLNNISDHYIGHLIYECQYRNISGMLLASKIYLLEMALRKEYP